MNIVKRAYQYLFYKLYKFCEFMPHPWWSEWKAALFISIIDLFLLLSFLLYYKFFIDRYFDFTRIQELLMFSMLVILLTNYYLFFYKSKWIQIVKTFDKLSKKKNRIGGWIVLAIIILVFANLLYPFYLGGQVDWSQYR